MVDSSAGTLRTRLERLQTMKGLLNNLVMLLSKEWFEHHWPAIGVTLEKSTRSLIQQGCREIVSQIMSGAAEYWLISFSPEHLQTTRSMLEALSKRCGAEKDILRAVEEWSAISEEDLKAGWLFETLTEDLLSNDESLIDYALDLELKTIVLRERKPQCFTEIDFARLSSTSRSSWDQYIKQLTPDLPTYLSDMLVSFLKARRFKTFWTAMLGKLTQEQREKLTTWYQITARSRAKRDIVPSYFSSKSLLM
jgi:hypothetical protein